MKRRVKVHNQTVIYHCISRVVGGEMLLGDTEKEILRKQMWQVADFCGIQILTYCIMSNHFHILIKVPHINNDDLTNQELVRRFSVLYPTPTPRQPMLVDDFEKYVNSSTLKAKELRDDMLSKMHDVSMFMKILKQRFTNWYNKTNGRFGTFWAERYKSLLIENTRTAKLILAAYIDLNPVRAKLVTDPKDYRFCGYGETTRGNINALNGISIILESNDSSAANVQDYRMLLYAGGSTSAKNKKPNAGKLEMQNENTAQSPSDSFDATSLHQKNRYLTDGMFLGRKDFVEECFTKFRDLFGNKRTSGSRKMKYHTHSTIFVARDLKKDINP
jgi:REP element-mobilizing transposase RayT